MDPKDVKQDILGSTLKKKQSRVAIKAALSNSTENKMDYLVSNEARPTSFAQNELPSSNE